jgi:hypothetical protein
VDRRVACDEIERAEYASDDAAAQAARVEQFAQDLVDLANEIQSGARMSAEAAKAALAANEDAAYEVRELGESSPYVDDAYAFMGDARSVLADLQGLLDDLDDAEA